MAFSLIEIPKAVPQTKSGPADQNFWGDLETAPEFKPGGANHALLLRSGNGSVSCRKQRQ
jgi:hypothetical protein